MTQRKLTALLSALAAFGASLALAAPALASHNELVFFEAPNGLLSASTRPATMTQLRSLGVHALRIVLYWRNVAPSPRSRRTPSFNQSDPSKYNWSAYDPAITEAHALGWKILLTVSGPVPRWATAGSRDQVTNPSSADFGRFMVAVGRHYKSLVNLISIWNEPNQPQYLMPQYTRSGLVSPALYRRLYLAGYAGLRSAGALSHVKVLMGETSPVGSRAADIPAPVAFLRGVLCLNVNYVKSTSCGRLPTSGYAQHPYAERQGPFWVPPTDDVTMGTLGRLVGALDRAARAGAVTAGLPVYVTEFGVQSHPDPFLGVPVRQQAEFLAISEQLAWINPRVASYDQYLLRDDPPLPGSALERWSGFQSGLEFSNGSRKPAFNGWRLPLTVTRTATGVALWGVVRPATGASTAEVQYSSDGGHTWRGLLVVHTNSQGYWSASARYAARRVWRVRWQHGSSTYFGATIRAYSTSGAVG